MQLIRYGVEALSSNYFPVIPRRHGKYTCILLYKTLHGMAPSKLKTRLMYVHEISVRSTRSSINTDLCIKKPRLELTKKAIFYRAAAYWNSLPVHVRVASILDTFKYALHAYYQ